ncbi:STAS domain-containing protein [Haemophilus parahaemolyticus]
MKPENTLQWSVSQNNESLVVQLKGELTRTTLRPLWEQRASFLSVKANQVIYWNLEQISRIDSAGFALLTELLNYYEKQTQISLIHVPQVFKTLAELYGLIDWVKQYIPNENQNVINT